MNGLASPARGAELAGAHTMEVDRGWRAQLVYAPPAVVQLAGARRPSSSRVHAMWPNSSPLGAGDEIARPSLPLTDVELAAPVSMGSLC